MLEVGQLDQLHPVSSFLREGEVPAESSCMPFSTLRFLRTSVQKSSLPFGCNPAAEKFDVKVRSSSIDFDHFSQFIGFLRSFTVFPRCTSSTRFDRVRSGSLFCGGPPDPVRTRPRPTFKQRTATARPPPQTDAPS